MQQRGELVRERGKRAVEAMLDAGSPGPAIDLAVEAGDGVGSKARVPWIRVFSRIYSPGATTGWYVVYLFAADGTAVYLSLNQGTGTVKGTHIQNQPMDEVEARTEAARQRLSAATRADGRLLTTIQLDSSRGMGEGYERGNVVAYRYERDRIPDDRHLQEDLVRLLRVLVVLYDDGTAGDDDDDEAPEPPSYPPVRPSFDVKLVQEEASNRGLSINQTVIPAIVAALKSGKHVMLTGPPGTAKTTLAETVAVAATKAGLSEGYALTTATSDWTTFETVGGLRPDLSGRLVFAPGQFVSAIQANRWLVIDELNRSNFDRAFGQLFTVLSGQAVELPYTDPGSGLPIVLAPEGVFLPTPGIALTVVPTSWRIIATMNVFDKSLLFEMSFALMRRFSFIEVPAPEGSIYTSLIRREARGDDVLAARIARVVGGFLTLRTVKELGPALFIDMAKYVRERIGLGDLEDSELSFQLFYSYLLPQFEGISDRDGRRLFELLRPIVGPSYNRRLRGTLRDVLGVEIRQAPGGQVPVDADVEDESDEL